MNIAAFYDLPLSGSKKIVDEQIVQLRKIHSVDLYCISDFSLNSKKSKDYIYQIKLDYIDGQINTINLIKFLCKSFFIQYQISKKINKKKYDLCIIYSSKITSAPFMTLFVKCKKILYINYINTYKYRFKYNYSRIRNITRFLNHITISYILDLLFKINTFSVNKILSSSKFIKEYIKKSYKINSRLCYMGVNESKFIPLKTKKNIDILFVGSSNVEKEEFSYFQKIIKFLNNDIKIKVLLKEIKWYSDKELINFYNQSRLIVCLEKFEPFGLTVLEAGSCGVPVLALREGGYKETVVDGKNGYFIGDNSVNAASKIEEYLRYNTEHKIGDIRENIIKNWTLDRSIKNLNFFIENTVEK